MNSNGQQTWFANIFFKVICQLNSDKRIVKLTVMDTIGVSNSLGWSGLKTVVLLTDEVCKDRKRGGNEL